LDRFRDQERNGRRKVAAGVGEGFPYRGDSGNDARPKDSSTTANQSVDRFGEPTDNLDTMSIMTLREIRGTDTAQQR